VFAIKVKPDGTIDCLKACLVVKDYTQSFGLGYDGAPMCGGW